jgi:diguanylate cyclase (GGDEF)-like protein
VANNLSAALRHAAIEHPRSPSGPRLTISIGVATAKKMAGVADDLVLLADKLLYAAKAAGRNQIKVGQLGAPAMTRAA